MSDNEQDRNHESNILSDLDLLQINMVAEAYTGSLPFEAIHQFAVRFHFHCMTQMFLEDPEKFQQLKTQHEIDTGQLTYHTQEITELLVNQIDELVGYKPVSEAKDGESQPELDVPDTEYFRNLGLL